MSGLTLADIREALADQIRSNVDRQITVATYPTDVPPPSVMLEADNDYVDYWLSFGSSGVAAVRFVLVVEPGGTDPKSAAIALDDFLSAGTGNGSSLVDAVMADTTLGLTGCNAVLTTVTVDPLTITARLSVTVHISKTGANA